MVWLHQIDGIPHEPIQDRLLVFAGPLDAENPLGLKRVARLMRPAGIQGLYRRRRRGCTVRDPDVQPSPDLVSRDFTVTEPNRLWVTGITEHPTRKKPCSARRCWMPLPGSSPAGRLPGTGAPNSSRTH